MNTLTDMPNLSEGYWLCAWSEAGTEKGLDFSGMTWDITERQAIEPYEQISKQDLIKQFSDESDEIELLYRKH